MEKVIVYSYNKEGKQLENYTINKTAENIANLLVTENVQKIIITDFLDNLILDTVCGFIDRCPDQKLLLEVLKYLIPLQQGEVIAYEVEKLSIGELEDESTSKNGYRLDGGHIVLSSPDSSYPLLVGIVKEVHPLGSESKDTDNLTDDIICNFRYFTYSEKRISEIEEDLTKLYGESKTIEELGLDEVIMRSSELIVLDDFSEDPTAGKEEALKAWVTITEAYALYERSKGEFIYTKPLD